VTTAATEVVWPRPQPGLWWLMPDAPLLPRVGHAMVWAGDAVFVWGGFDVVGPPLTDGGLFDPASGTSERLPPLDVGDTTASYVAWSGADVYVVSATATYLFDPTREAWNAFPPPPVPDGHILTGQLVGTGDGIIVLSRSGRDAEAPRPAIPVRTRRPRPAMFRFERADREWRRLPDPPARFADADRVVVQRGRRPDGRRPRSGWSCAAVVPAGTLAEPPGLGALPLVRLLGAVAGDRAVLVGVGVPGERGYAAVHDGRRWRRADPPSLPASPHVDGLWIGEGLIVWNRFTGVGAQLELRSARWTRFAACPSPTGRPGPPHGRDRAS